MTRIWNLMCISTANDDDSSSASLSRAFPPLFHCAAFCLGTHHLIIFLLIPPLCDVLTMNLLAAFSVWERREDAHKQQPRGGKPYNIKCLTDVEQVLYLLALLLVFRGELHVRVVPLLFLDISYSFHGSLKHTRCLRTVMFILEQVRCAVCVFFCMIFMLLWGQISTLLPDNGEGRQTSILG